MSVFFWLLLSNEDSKARILTLDPTHLEHVAQTMLMWCVHTGADSKNV